MTQSHPTRPMPIDRKTTLIRVGEAIEEIGGVEAEIGVVVGDDMEKKIIEGGTADHVIVTTMTPGEGGTVTREVVVTRNREERDAGMTVTKVEDHEGVGIVEVRRATKVTEDDKMSHVTRA